MSATFSILGSALVVCATRFYWERVFGMDQPNWRAGFRLWLIKGLALPVFLWAILNSGLLPGLPSIVPDPRLARFGRAGWLPAFLDACGAGLFVIAAFWGATTMAWMVVLIGLNAGPNRKEMLIGSSIAAVLLSPVLWTSSHFHGLPGLATAMLLWLLPILHFYHPLLPKKKPRPTFSSAIAKIKFGKYKDAEWLVIQELENAQDNFDGWMMLAQLYAENFGDLEEADRTIRQLCEQPNLITVQVSLALHRLADWHLKLAQDPVAARRALAEIESKFPGTHAARMAQLRRGQLPATTAQFREQQQTKPIPLPPLGDLQDDDDAPARPSPLRKDDALAQANQCIQKLNQNPNDIPTREKFARLLAEHLGKAELGTAQLELLLEIPGQPPEKAAEWLALMAAWQLKLLQNLEAGRKTLRRLIHEFPQSPQAFAAQRRLNLLPDIERASK